jgi:hypothetical protein
MPEPIRNADERCTRCGSREFVDVVLTYPPHNGGTTRRDCARCNLFARWVRWYGEPIGQLEQLRQL